MPLPASLPLRLQLDTPLWRAAFPSVVRPRVACRKGFLQCMIGPPPSAASACGCPPLGSIGGQQLDAVPIPQGGSARRRQAKKSSWTGRFFAPREVGGGAVRVVAIRNRQRAAGASAWRRTRQWRGQASDHERAHVGHFLRAYRVDRPKLGLWAAGSLSCRASLV